MFSTEPPKKERCRVLYVSPLKALAVDVERNLRAPIAGIAAVAGASGETFRVPVIGIRSGDTPAADRARMSRTPPDILITRSTETTPRDRPSRRSSGKPDSSRGAVGT
jgi:ATP-dependent Lhr-like helicase